MKTESDFLAFVAAATWTTSTSIAYRQWPHQYVVRQKFADDLRFEDAVRFIRANGRERPFFRKFYIYFEVDGWTYWTMGAPVPETTIINRCRPETCWDVRYGKASTRL